MLVHSATRATPLVVAIVAMLLVAPVLACSRMPDQPNATNSASRQTYSTRGKVRAIGERKDNVTIAHEEIPGYMKAMTMMFEVERPEILNDIKVDDQVSFTFSDRDGRLFVESITKMQ